MLTDTKIRQTKPSDKPIKLTDSNGLYLLVSLNGSKLWRYRYKINGKENTFAIGSYPEISLSQARIERDNARKLVKQGIHPSQQRAIDKLQQTHQNQNTFKIIAEEFLNSKTDCIPSYVNGIERDFKNYAYPIIGNLPIRQITPAHIMACLNLCKEKGIIATGINLRQRMSNVFMLAIRTMRAEHDPTLAFVDYFQRPITQHAEAMSREQLIEFIKKLKEYNGTRVVKIAIWLMLYTAVRTIEIRRAEWQDFRLPENLWKIPAHKMKKRRIHLVPLSQQVIQLLEELHTISGNEKLLFPNSKRKDDMMSVTTINRALEYMGVSFTAHDFRATASTHLNEMGYDERYIEMQLAHAETNQTKASYNHAKYLEPRRQMMQAWADWLDELS
ncbi:tyrosine-type recombinase/integrase [Wielerella bovis]|uniref:tyrosine-type recombinase/integrase n=1 Tax=Wielerella bovis TaxID=2917790 RepID=UPI002018A283|nr:integrase arm-type DNA-binding domain-containing protein [Wielerella bovis]MCG7657104.1 tyrosine-type recombinase/integrase [Wielerella bovis]MCG7659327.1 tyrosine-type recombinase/integrase [Wielerella bovis]